MKEHRTLVTAHSGADGFPENSMEFVRYALGCGADTLEVDVRLDEEKKLIISHDKIQGEAVTLREVFETVNPVSGIRINCDLKEYGLEEAVFCLAQTCGLHPERILYSGSVTPVKKEEPCPWREVEIYWNVEECLPGVYDCPRGEAVRRITAEMARRLGEACGAYGVSTINIHEKFLNKAVAEEMNRRGVGISVWTVNDAGRIWELLGSGVKNITSRKPRLVLALREDREKEKI